MHKSLQALGRLKAGEMNKTEKAYDSHLKRMLNEGKILWYKFEAIKFRLADRTYYTPDFLVLNNRNELEVHEVKGSPSIFFDDAKVKVKACADIYPLAFFVAFPKKGSRMAQWDVNEV